MSHSVGAASAPCILCLLGEPGVGKTHLAVALGLKAIERGYRVLFTTAADLIAALTWAAGQGRLDLPPTRASGAGGTSSATA